MIKEADTYRAAAPTRDHVAGRTCSEAPEPVLGQPIERATAILPANLLDGDEVILLLLKPSPWYILLASLGSLLVLGAIVGVILVAATTWDLSSISRRTVLYTGALLAFVRLSWQVFEWLSRVYVLTDRRVIRIRGVVQVEVFQAPLSKLQHTGLVFTFLERVFGLGTISFATAGTAYAEAYWVMLSKPIQVHQRVIDAIDRYGGGSARLRHGGANGDGRDPDER